MWTAPLFDFCGSAEILLSKHVCMWSGLNRRCGFSKSIILLGCRKLREHHVVLGGVMWADAAMMAVVWSEESGRCGENVSEPLHRFITIHPSLGRARQQASLRYGRHIWG